MDNNNMSGVLETQERRLPVAYALPLSCVVFMLVSMLIGDSVRHNMHPHF